MRIAYIIAGFPKASETFVSREVTALLARGIEVEIFALTRPDSTESARLSGQARALIDRIHYIDHAAALRAIPYAATKLEARELNDALAKRTKGKPMLRLLRAAAIAREAERLGVTRIHAHWPQATQLAMLVHAMTRLPISASVHAHEVAHDSGHFELAFERLDFACFCNGAAMTKLLAQTPAGVASRCHLVYHGVDLQGFPEQPLPAAAQGTLRIFSAGRLTKTKGFARLLRAVSRARELGCDAHLTIAGEGAERESLEALADQLGIRAHVDLPGWVAHDEMAKLVAQSHLFALLADCNFHDGLPNVVLEAMASGRPVVLSPLPAAAEAVQHGQSGFVLGDADAIEECAQLFRDLSTDHARLRSLGHAARLRAQADFDEAKSLDSLVHLFQTAAIRHPDEARRVTGSPTLSVVTIAKNEERDLPNFLASFLPWVDEIVICDDGSTDRTEEIARAAGPKVKFLRSPREADEGFHSQRNKAIQLSTCDWLLHVDVDMRLTPEFAREMRAAIQDPDKDVYSYRRANYFLNVPLFHATSPSTRFPWLVRRGVGRFAQPVHEVLEFDVPHARQGSMHNRLHHLGDDFFEERLRKNVHYSLLERDRMRAAGRQTNMVDLLVRPPYLMMKSLLLRQGFLDGRAGVFWALYQASGSLNRYLLEYADTLREDREALDLKLLGPAPTTQRKSEDAARTERGGADPNLAET